MLSPEKTEFFAHFRSFPPIPRWGTAPSGGYVAGGAARFGLFAESESWTVQELWWEGVLRGVQEWVTVGGGGQGPHLVNSKGGQMEIMTVMYRFGIA